VFDKGLRDKRPSLPLRKSLPHTSTGFIAQLQSLATQIAAYHRQRCTK